MQIIMVVVHNYNNITVYCLYFGNCTVKTSIDVVPSKNQALCEFCTHVSKLKHC